MADNGQDEENVSYGYYEGSDTKYVKLVSSDEHEFIVKREHAFMSGTIKAMMSGPGLFKENEENVVRLRQIPSHILKEICKFMTHKAYYKDSINEVPKFSISPELGLELFLAANFLDL